MKHKWKVKVQPYNPGWPGAQYCTKCGESFDAPFHVLDGDRIQKYINKQFTRNDCKGKA